MLFSTVSYRTKKNILYNNNFIYVVRLGSLLIRVIRYYKLCVLVLIFSTNYLIFNIIINFVSIILKLKMIFFFIFCINSWIKYVQ